MEKVFARPSTLVELPLPFCPGCGHGIIVRLMCEVLEEMELVERTVCVAPVGCGGYINHHLGYDSIKSLHGRAPAHATAIKRLMPENLVFAYQGDGDLAAEGMAEIIHAVARIEKISVIFINNGVYGETGGQGGPTTLLGQVTSTSPKGRDYRVSGVPMKIAELLASLVQQSGGLNQGYIVRRSVHDAKNIVATRAAIRRAFENQLAGKGFSLVEVLSPCPPGWKLTPPEAMKWIRDKMIPYYPLGDFCVPGQED